MKKYRGGLPTVFLFLLVALIFASSAAAFSINELQPNCIINSVNCRIVSDTTSGECRTVNFDSSYGQIKIGSCVKGDYLEVYRQAYPSGTKFNACLANVCIDQIGGFQRKLISDITL